MLKIGFIRTSTTGPSAECQRTALLRNGVTEEHIVVDDRKAAVSKLSDGDLLVVMAPECFGYPEHDILAGLADVGRRGAVLYDLQSNKRIEWSPAVDPIYAYALQGGSQGRKNIMEHARTERTKTGSFGGIPPISWTDKMIADLRRMADAKVPRQEIADHLGVSRATVQRKLREIRDKKK
jgi:DNA invertase Pin-like site-specific DNA recombinase